MWSCTNRAKDEVAIVFLIHVKLLVNMFFKWFLTNSTGLRGQFRPRLVHAVLDVL